MIYEFPDTETPLKQGDILYPIPSLGFINLNQISIMNENGDSQVSDWLELQHSKENMVLTKLDPVWGIIGSQDCDVARVPFLSIFLIDEFLKISRRTPPKTEKAWMKTITTHSRMNASWFYLPEDSRIGFTTRMAIHFHRVFQIPRSYIEKHIDSLRKGRLNKIAYEHYRENIAQYFRRYPYDEWYPLTKDEFKKYIEENKLDTIKPFKWQE